MKKDEISVIPPDSKKTLEQFFRYFSLSSLLFDRGKREIYNVTDIPGASKFRKIAKQTAKRLGVRWQEMSHEDARTTPRTSSENAITKGNSNAIPAQNITAFLIASHICSETLVSACIRFRFLAGGV